MYLGEVSSKKSKQMTNDEQKLRDIEHIPERGFVDGQLHVEHFQKLRTETKTKWRSNSSAEMKPLFKGSPKFKLEPQRMQVKNMHKVCQNKPKQCS